MNAMTWWDHETDSIWSQPWGLAIGGPLKGTRLEMIAASITPWAPWLADHPDTLALHLEVGRLGIGPPRERFNDRYVIGVTLGEHAKGYPFRLASRQGVINDWLGPSPVLVLAVATTGAVHVYLRRVEGKELEFTMRDGELIDRQTGSTWNTSRGIAVDGPLKGTLLKQVPYMSAYDWAWKDFYPHSEFYGQDS